MIYYTILCYGTRQSTRADTVIIMKESKELVIIEGSIPDAMNLPRREESELANTWVWLQKSTHSIM